MEIGVHRHRRFQVHPWNWTKKRHMKASQFFFYSRFYSEQRLSRMCGHRARNLLVLRSPQFSFTLGQQSLCRHKSVLAICVFLIYKRRYRQNHLSQSIRWSAGPALPALSERNECIKDRKNKPKKMSESIP